MTRQPNPEHLAELRRILEDELPFNVHLGLRVETLEPGHATAMANLALLLMARGDNDLGMFLAHRAVELLPGHADTRHALGKAHAARGNRRQALELYRAALGSAAGSPTLLLLGRSMLALQDLQGARQAFERGILAAPDDAEMRAGLAVTLFASSDLETARSHYAWLLERRPDLDLAWRDMGHILTMDGRFEAAGTHLDRALALRDEHCVRFRRGSLHFRQGHLEAAAQEFELACLRAPKETAPPRFLHYVRRLLDGHDEAEVRLGDVAARFGLTGRNMAVEIAHANGEFYEAKELDHLRRVLPRPDTVLDVGANAGNHAVYFALGLGARLVVPFEFHPLMAEALKANSRRNGVEANMDFSRLGVALSDAPGRARLVDHPSRDLCLTEMLPAPDGDLAVEPLDALNLPTAQLIKVDVQGGETSFLDGAAGYLRRCRPHLLVEVNDVNEAAFMQRAAALDYAPRTMFRVPGYTNVHLVPAGNDKSS